MLLPYVLWYLLDVWCLGVLELMDEVLDVLLYYVAFLLDV